MKVPEGLWLCLSFGCAASLSPSCLSAQFRRNGDFILGGLFPFGKETVNLRERAEPTLLRCERGAIALRRNYSDYRPRVTALLGPHNSDLCLLTAKLFSSFLIPQVSYGASSESLSNTELFPSFYRTVPGDKNLAEALVLLLSQFGWNWVATVASDDEYGRGAQALFLSMAGADNICIAFEGLIPADLAEPSARGQLENIIKLINSTKVNVVVLFAHSLPAQALLEHSIRMGLGKKVWIGTEAWLLSDIAASTPDIQSVGTVLGFVMRAGTVPGFQEYVAELFSSVVQEEFCQESRRLSGLLDAEVLGTRCQHCDHVTLGDIWPMLTVTVVQPVQVAVYSVAHALHRALGCTSKGCPKTPIRSWQLLHFMNTLPFEVNGQSFRFDQSHGTNTGYKLIFWAWRDGSVTYLPVGDYDQSLYIQKSQIQFHTPDKKEPTSECFRRCQPGQFRRVKGFNLCCYDCTDCSENTFWSGTDSPGCSPCPQHQWAPARSTRCLQRGERFLSWRSPPAVALLALAALTGSASGVAALLFLRHLRSPLVRLAGGSRSVLALLCLGCALFVGRPGAALCALQQLCFALCLNGCFSCLLPKALEVALLAEFPRCAPRLLGWLTRGRAWLMVAASLLIQVLLCCCHLYLGPDYLVLDYKSLPSEVLLVCGTQSWAAFALLHGYNGFLAFLCFLCTFMVQTPGSRYNVARGITFATLICLVVWIFFLVIFATLRTVLRAVTQICTILATTLGILASYFVPKCYILLFRPDLNTEDYCQNLAEEQPEVNRQ
ncbi:PREDICTED: taste receptor type 1 member 3 [Ficedula albicollis]|uniref:taste receptor type 1 member 3 n=1 Tax=Ficedula albicollis TaxID=59894 RepID=UPI0007AD8698|nr:PREDICTED: taste receptor type 1 member 3 [Ficedula albicollis]